MGMESLPTLGWFQSGFRGQYECICSLVHYMECLGKNCLHRAVRKSHHGGSSILGVSLHDSSVLRPHGKLSIMCCQCNRLDRSGQVLCGPHSQDTQDLMKNRETPTNHFISGLDSFLGIPDS